MQSSIKKYYRIGDLRILYTGPNFYETENLKIFSDRNFPEQMDDVTYPYDSEIKNAGVNNADIYINIEKPDPAANYNTRFFMKELNLPAKVLDHDAVFLHSSYIIWHDKAILFTAPKQTGKSTQAVLWEKYKGAEIVNGDRALIRRNSEQTFSSETSSAQIDNVSLKKHLSDGEKREGWTVYGSPYCGTSKICKNKSACLSAIVILGQASENEIRPASIGERVQAMLDGCSYDTADKEQVRKVMNLVMKTVPNVPFVKLNCLPDQTAADILEEYLCRMGII